MNERTDGQPAQGQVNATMSIYLFVHLHRPTDLTPNDPTTPTPNDPTTGDGLTAVLTEEGTIPDETFQKAMVRTVEESLAAANRIGYPVMLKASEGGGGKGIRMSNNDEELRTNFVQVSNEVPGSPMFMMQLCTQARHIEVQIVGDEHGNAVALNGRDCSTQRRFQKIFEEGPPTIVPPAVFKQMELAAQRLTQNIGYIGAGTVEYLFNAESGKYFFLELNPRLQVEHPVTEGLSLVNLPATQLQVAMGIPLNAIPDIRRFYGKPDPYGSSKIDFMTEDYAPLPSHVIAARITAENPDEGFKPTSGRIERVKFQSTANVWGYFSVGANGALASLPAWLPACPAGRVRVVMVHIHVPPTLSSHHHHHPTDRQAASTSMPTPSSATSSPRAPPVRTRARPSSSPSRSVSAHGTDEMDGPIDRLLQ